MEQSVAENLKWFKNFPYIEFLLFIIAGLTFYYQFWKPFDLSIHLNGRYKLSVNHIGNRIYQTAITLGISFTNAGARTGFVEYVLLNLVNEDGDYNYISVLNDLNEEISFPMSAASVTSETRFNVFKAFSIPGHTTISKEIFFVPYDNTTPRITPGQYNISIHLKSSNDNSFKENIANAKIVIEQADYEGFPPFKTFEEAQVSYDKPYTLKFLTQDKILPEMDELIRNIK